MFDAASAKRHTLAYLAAFVLLLIAGLASAVAAPPTVDNRPWLDTSMSVDDRAHALLDQMTLAEKIGQMWQVNGVGGQPTGNAQNLVEGSALYNLVREGEVGSVLNEISPATSNALQKVAVEESRLGVPLIFGRDVIHGFRTIFPIPLGQAASWNPELVQKAAAVAAREARSQGVHWTFAPMVDIARDPRWGRIAEGLGEDPCLASQLSAAMVRGFQGEKVSGTFSASVGAARAREMSTEEKVPDTFPPDHVAACAKHFAGYGAAEGGRDYNTTVISPELMQNVYLPPFHAAVEAGVATLMCSFNEINGVPNSANTHLLRDVLRRQWGFRGFVVSDWDSILETVKHGYAADERAAALAAVRAGVNMEMVSHTYHDYLADLVHQGAVSESTIDQLVLEILRVKFRLGLFEHPYTDTSKPAPLLTPEHLDLARRLARQSVVMLKNDTGTLPLDLSQVKKLAVIGPLADAPWDQLGTWIPDGRESDSRTLLAAVRERAGNGVEVLYAPGLANGLDRSTAGFDRAVAAARQADVVLLAVGEPASLSGEARSRAILDLPGAQNELVEAIAAVGKPVVMIVQAGRPLTIGRQIEEVDAVLYSLHAGTMAGPALMDLVCGDESPSGKLPLTMPKTVGQIPLYYNHKNTGRPPRPYDFETDNAVDDRINTELGFNSNYIDVGPYPLYPFGYGLSYTTFSYGKVELPSPSGRGKGEGALLPLPPGEGRGEGALAQLRPGETLTVRVLVTNTGKVAADEIVQLYVRDLAASITRPVRELKGLRRVHVAPGETTDVEFTLAADDLAFYNNEEQRVLEPGKFELYVGGSSLAPLAGEFELVK